MYKYFTPFVLVLQTLLVILKIASVLVFSWYFVLLPIELFGTFLLCFLIWLGYQMSGYKIRF